MFKLPKLDYNYDELEPSIDKRTVKIHHSKHHQGYTDKFNAALEKLPKKFHSHSAEDILKNLDDIPEELKMDIQNYGGGYYNHNLYWENLTPHKTKPSASLLSAIEKQFENLDVFKEEFNKKALSVFGSGWAWLLMSKDRKLILKRTSFQNNPISKKPEIKIILAIDVWEHSYYLKYKNQRAEYVKALWEIVNWEKANERFEK